MKKLIESPKEWLEFYKKLNELYNFHLEYYGPENDCIKGYTSPYFLPIKYPVIISGYSTISGSGSGIDNWTTLTFTFIYLTDFFKDEDC